MPSVAVLAFFTNRDEAQDSAAELTRHRLPRVAPLLKDRHGANETWDSFSRRLVGASLSIVIWASCSAWRRSS